MSYSSIGIFELKVVGHMSIRAGFSLSFLALISAFPTAEAEVVLKSGSCPIGYQTQGNYCVSNRENTPIAVTKVGDCPIGYQTQGDYCVSSKDREPQAVVKDGNCPVGYTTQGRYCVEGPK